MEEEKVCLTKELQDNLENCELEKAQEEIMQDFSEEQKENQEDCSLPTQQEEQSEKVGDYIYVSAPVVQNHKKPNLICTSSIICSLWAILACLFQPIGLILTGVSLFLLIKAIPYKKTQSFQWALSLNIVSAIVSVIFSIIL